MLSFVVVLMLGAAAPARLPPVEQCRGDADFDKFRRRLERAVASRDNQKLAPLMAPDVRLSFGGGIWFPKFQNYQQSGPGGDGMWQNALWDEMAKVLRLGCGTVRSNGGIQYRAWPAMYVGGESLEAYDTWVSLPGAILWRGSGRHARIAQRLPAWTVLHELGQGYASDMKVRTPKGRAGFVRREQMRGLLDYRLIAQRRGGRWLVTAFVAGD
jgi:hypothetical protein